MFWGTHLGALVRLELVLELEQELVLELELELVPPLLGILLALLGGRSANRLARTRNHLQSLARPLCVAFGFDFLALHCFAADMFFFF